MLLSEQVRIIRDEEILVNDTTLYRNTEQGDWRDMATKEITLSKETLVYVKFTTAMEGAANFRVLCNDVPLVATGYVGIITRQIFFVLAAGSYTLKFQSSFFDGSYADFTLIYISVLNFSDQSKQAYDSGTIEAPVGQTTTVIDQNFTTPSARKLAAGSIKKYTCLIAVYMRGDERRSMVKNPGEAENAGFNWKLFMDDIQRSWTVRGDDIGWGYNYAWGCGAHGFYVATLNPATQYNLKIKVYCYDYGTNVRATVRIVICPWIIPNSEYEPLSLDVPQGSTLYFTLEPLDANPTKSLKIGKKRFVSFGDSTDYYVIQSGTGIVQVSHTFEVLQVVNSVVLVEGYGGCISSVGVDVR